MTFVVGGAGNQGGCGGVEDEECWMCARAEQKGEPG